MAAIRVSAVWSSGDVGNPPAATIEELSLTYGMDATVKVSRAPKVTYEGQGLCTNGQFPGQRFSATPAMSPLLSLQRGSYDHRRRVRSAVNSSELSTLPSKVQGSLADVTPQFWQVKGLEGRWKRYRP
jgi:hypothetical protein